MSSEHNPIARKIDQLREFWIQETGKFPDYLLARWLMVPDDMDLLVGLLKLESTPYGQLPEVFVVMISPFDSLDTFSYQLVNDWINMYKLEREKDNGDNYTWDYLPFEEELKKRKKTKQADDLLLEMLKNFKQYLKEKDRLLVFGLIPQHIASFDEYNLWLDKLINKLKLSNGIKLLAVDHSSKGYLNDVCKNNKKTVLTLEPGDMDISGAMKDIATSGNPNDPQVQMRKCMFEMSDAVAKKNKQKLYKWGEEIIKVGQRSGQKSFFASVFLIYSGFLMQFKETERIDGLLERAIRIAKGGLPDQTDCISVLMQLYAFKGSNFALAKDFKKAVEWYEKQANFCVEHKFSVMAISAYKNAILIADKKNIIEDYERCSKSGYELGVKMENEELKQSEYALVGFNYFRILKDKDEIEARKIKKRMSEIFGADWEEKSEKMAQQIKSKKPVEAM